MKNSREVVLSAIRSLCYERREFTLASGKKSDFYIDLRTISFDGNYLFHIGKMLYEDLKNHPDLNFSVLAGIPVGGLPLVSSMTIVCSLDNSADTVKFGGVSSTQGRSLGLLKSVVIRKEKKGYGKGNLIEPTQFLSKGCKILIVEDVVTTGGSILVAVKSARAEGYDITDALCVVDRNEGGKENLQKNGVTLHSIFSKSDIEQSC